MSARRARAYIYTSWPCLALTSANFLNYSDNKWYATVGTNNHNSVDLYANDWTDERHYICQYDSE